GALRLPGLHMLHPERRAWRLVCEAPGLAPGAKSLACKAPQPCTQGSEPQPSGSEPCAPRCGPSSAGTQLPPPRSPTLRASPGARSASPGASRARQKASRSGLVSLECRAPELESRGSEACTQSPQEGVRIFVCRVPSLALAAPGLARKARSLASGASFLARKARSPGGISLPPASGAYRLVRRV